MTSNKYPRRMLAAALMTPLLIGSAACAGDSAGSTDSAAGTTAMTDSAGMTTGGAMPNQTAQMDQPIAQLLATSNRGEIASSELANTKARNAEVKAFAQQMVQEHQAAMQQLTTMASAGGWTIDSAAIMSGASGVGSGAAGMSDSAHNMAGMSTGAAGTGAAGTGAAGSGTGAQGGNNMQLTSAIQQMQQMMATSMQQLRGQSGAAFDRAYMDAQLAAHQQTLDLLRQYSTSVQNNELRSHVTQMQGSVEQHLQKAKEIRGKLGS